MGFLDRWISDTRSQDTLDGFGSTVLPARSSVAYQINEMYLTTGNAVKGKCFYIYNEHLKAVSQTAQQVVSMYLTSLQAQIVWKA